MNQPLRNSIVNTVKIALFAAIISVCSMISIPFPVPFTLQTFGVYAALFMLGGRCGSIATALYIGIGALGLPVFSGFTGGVGRLFDFTGGFIWGFLIASLVFWVCELIFKGRRFASPVSVSISLASLYALGCLQFMLVNGGVGFFAAVLTCVCPFLLPDIVKISLAYLISKRINKALR